MCLFCFCFQKSKSHRPCGNSSKCVHWLFYHLQCHSTVDSYVTGTILGAVVDSRETGVTTTALRVSLSGEVGTAKTAPLRGAAVRTKSDVKKGPITDWKKRTQWSLRVNNARAESGESEGGVISKDWGGATTLNNNQTQKSALQKHFTNRKPKCREFTEMEPGLKKRPLKSPSQHTWRLQPSAFGMCSSSNFFQCSPK